MRRRQIMNRQNNGNILFVRQKTRTKIKLIYDDPRSTDDSKSPILYLPFYNFNIFDFLPRLFTITTSNGSCKFNTHLLANTSSVIYAFIIENPQNTEYHLDINDEEHVLSKFEHMYQGEFVFFDEEELVTAQKITKLLNIKNCPNFLKPESLKDWNEQDDVRSSFYMHDTNLSVQMDFCSMCSYLEKNAPKTFSIVTRKKEYKCNVFGVYSSQVIRKILMNNPTIDRYIYDYEDEFNEFQFICDFFNFKKVELTKNNIDQIKDIAEELKIILISEDVNNYIDEVKKVSQAIDEHQTIVDSIEELFDSLLHINLKTAEKVADSIVESDWSKTEDAVKELAAFILQVIKIDFSIHQQIEELLILLDQKANESNKLNILMPFVLKHLLRKLSPKQTNNNNDDDYVDDFNSSSPSEITYISFIYKLYKKGIISKKKIYRIIQLGHFQNPFLKIWFLPEIMEKLPPSDINEIYNGIQNTNIRIKEFIDLYLPNKLDLYKKMRDCDEPSDELTKALRKDDVDTLQRIISMSKADLSDNFVPFNIFENFIDNGRTRYINYAAAYGSIKCFKYMLLNHFTIDSNTFSHAVYGGNIEIIKIVEQKESYSEIFGNNDKVKYSHYSTYIMSDFSHKTEQIKPSIMKHQNDIFNWIFENKFSDNEQYETLSSLIDYSVLNGNASALIEIFDKGFKFQNNRAFFESIQKAASKGFYKLTQLLFNITNLQPSLISQDNKSFAIDSIAFENISLLNMLYKFMSQKCLEYCLQLSICNNFMGIIKFLFETVANKSFKLTYECVTDLIDESILCNRSEITKYIIEQIKILNPKFFTQFNNFNNLLDIACKGKNTDIMLLLIDLIIESQPDFNFTSHFCLAAFENKIVICNYLIKKDVNIKYGQLPFNINMLGSITIELFTTIINRVNNENKEIMFELLPEAIKKHNNSLVKYILKVNKNPKIDDALLLAVQTNDLELVNIILEYNHSPQFVNKISKDGTALTIATSKSNLQIVKRLLSIPGINPDLYNKNGKTALIEAIDNLNLEVLNAILDFYGENIKNQKYQIDKAIRSIFDINKNNINFIKKININNDIEQKKEAILNRLFEIKCVDPNYLFENNTLLTYACSRNNIELVQKLLKCDDINVNLYETDEGNTPLLIAVQKNFSEIAKLLINAPQTNINQKNFDNETPLTLAVVNCNEEIIDLLIKNEKFDPKESSLDFAFYLSDGSIFKKFSSLESLDVNYNDTERDMILSYSNFNIMDTKSSMTTLRKAVNDSDIEKIDFIVNHPSFDKFRSQIHTAIFDCIEQNKIGIFKQLVKSIDNDVNIIGFDDNSLLDMSVIFYRMDFLIEIINNPTFDSKKSNILRAFRKCYLPINNIRDTDPKNASFYIDLHIRDMNEFANTNTEDKFAMKIKLMTELYHYDQEHDHLINLNELLENGHSFFTDFNYKNDTNEIMGIVSERHESTAEFYKFFLENGADPNIQDKFGKYPLQYALEKESSECVIVLVDSGKVDFTKKISMSSITLNRKLVYDWQQVNDGFENVHKETTFIHFAALTNAIIFKIFLTRNLMDINATNDVGETPLMIACRFDRRDIVNLLFQEDELDYLHCNNFGKDALEIISPACGDPQIRQSKEEYHLALMRSMKIRVIPYTEPSLNNPQNEIRRAYFSNFAGNNGAENFSLKINKAFPGLFTYDIDTNDFSNQKENSESDTSKTSEDSTVNFSLETKGNKAFPGLFVSNTDTNDASNQKEHLTSETTENSANNFSSETKGNKTFPSLFTFNIDTNSSSNQKENSTSENSANNFSSETKGNKIFPSLFTFNIDTNSSSNQKGNSTFETTENSAINLTFSATGNNEFSSLFTINNDSKNKTNLTSVAAENNAFLNLTKDSKDENSPSDSTATSSFNSASNKKVNSAPAPTESNAFSNFSKINQRDLIFGKPSNADSSSSPLNFCISSQNGPFTNSFNFADNDALSSPQQIFDGKEQYSDDDIIYNVELETDIEKDKPESIQLQYPYFNRDLMQFNDFPKQNSQNEQNVNNSSSISQIKEKEKPNEEKE